MRLNVGRTRTGGAEQQGVAHIVGVERKVIRRPVPRFESVNHLAAPCGLEALEVDSLEPVHHPDMSGFREERAAAVLLPQTVTIWTSGGIPYLSRLLASCTSIGNATECRVRDGEGASIRAQPEDGCARASNGDRNRG